MNQLPLQRRIVRQTLPNLMLFAAPNLTCRTKLIQAQFRRRASAVPNSIAIWFDYDTAEIQL